MRKALVALILMLSVPTMAAANICAPVNDAKKVMAGASVGGIAGFTIGKAAGGVKSVAHSSGARILTGPAGYIPRTIGFVASVVGVVTSPLFIAPVIAAGTAYVTVCAAMPDL